MEADHQGALDDVEEAMAIRKRIDFTPHYGAVGVQAMCLVLLDRPAEAPEYLDRHEDETLWKRRPSP